MRGGCAGHVWRVSHVHVSCHAISPPRLVPVARVSPASARVIPTRTRMRVSIRQTQRQIRIRMGIRMGSRMGRRNRKVRNRCRKSLCGRVYVPLNTRHVLVMYSSCALRRVGGHVLIMCRYSHLTPHSRSLHHASCARSVMCVCSSCAHHVSICSCSRPHVMFPPIPP